MPPGIVIILGPRLGAADIQTDSLHVNFTIDLPVKDWAIRPYVGAGIGATYVNFEDFSGGFTNHISRFSTDSIDFSWQAIGGVSRCIGRLELFSEYRFFSVSNVDFIQFQTVQSPPVQNLRANYYSNNLIFGLRMRF